jgi:hypothetical protein
MRFSRIERPLGRPVVWLAGTVVLTMAAGISTGASARKATVAKAYGTAAAQDGLVLQQKPVKLRYFGGPKSAMYSE